MRRIKTNIDDNPASYRKNQVAMTARRIGCIAFQNDRTRPIQVFLGAPAVQPDLRTDR